jgi:OOP family OmpA-OmpF porin
MVLKTQYFTKGGTCMKKKMLCTLAAALIVSSTAAFGAVKEGTFTLTPLIGGYIYDGGTYLDPSLVFGVRGGYNFTKNIGIEAVYDYANRTDGKFGPLTGISLHRFGGQALYHFCPDKTLVPYVAAGYSGVNFEGDGMDTKTHGAFDFGLGAKYFLNDDFALRADVRHILYRYNSATFNDLEFTLGGYIQFGAPAPAMKAVAAEPAPAPEPVKVVAAPAPVSIPVPAPIVVPEPVKAIAVPIIVAPLDTDGDGVIDPLDKCPGTPKGVAVDNNGCPVDSDNDGVADYLDKCPATPAGVAIDTNGCPIDTDKDGVADYLDKCPGTPAGVTVDINGCPVDSDKDGVADYLDKCPDTPAGVIVGANGCAVEAAKKFCDKPAVIEISFDANKADVKSRFHAELDKLGNFMKEFPSSKGTLEGHTDTDGSKEANLKLSQARADSVRNYIVNKFGIDGNRITAKGYGSAKPVASNKTNSGKAKNRRIEAVFICE